MKDNKYMEVPPKALALIKKQNVCSLSTTLVDGSPHAAVLHYSFGNSPLEIYFSTDKTSKKCKVLVNKKSVKGSFVIGFVDDEPTLQMDGDIEMITDKSKSDEISVMHYQKNPGSAEFKDDPNTIFLVFRPTWWRYTEYKPEYLILSSD